MQVLFLAKSIYIKHCLNRIQTRLLTKRKIIFHNTGQYFFNFIPRIYFCSCKCCLSVSFKPNKRAICLWQRVYYLHYIYNQMWIFEDEYTWVLHKNLSALQEYSTVSQVGTRKCCQEGGKQTNDSPSMMANSNDLITIQTDIKLTQGIKRLSYIQCVYLPWVDTYLPHIKVGLRLYQISVNYWP